MKEEKCMMIEHEGTNKNCELAADWDCAKEEWSRTLTFVYNPVTCSNCPALRALGATDTKLCEIITKEEAHEEKHQNRGRETG